MIEIKRKKRTFDDYLGAGVVVFIGLLSLVFVFFALIILIQVWVAFVRILLFLVGVLLVLYLLGKIWYFIEDKWRGMK